MHFIFEIHMQPGYPPERYAQAWVRASEIIQQYAGAQGTRLHRKIGEPDVLLAIATWASREQRLAMEDNMDARVRAIIEEQAEFVEVKMIGEYEAPEWEVLPA
ncbi:MAG: antibiotic biosynthesis monooxygenase [Halioglobus sp.]|nr:antibiotic biosynthesis monooxygenase [Halioglobus sp.]